MMMLSVRGMLATAALFSLCSAVSADENRLYITQDSGLFDQSGNTIFVDQSLATNSIVLGVPDGVALNNGTISPVDPANSPLTQIGSANSATVNLSGAFSLGMLSQNGNGNNANINVSGAGSIGAIRQTGDRNFGEVDVTGGGLTGILIQKGNDNAQVLNVTNANVIWTQNGDNIALGSGVPGLTPPSVVSNGGTVIVTQTK
ncbi:hypothetical protein [Sulfitobacter sp. 915]|uniref:hypothetical protein n=1 Tax=Sulfitobacter sp. 915 TaxID=3368558 RepID=UPI003746BBD0